MEAKYSVVVLGCLKKLNTEKEVVEEYVNYLSAIVAKKEAMSFSVIYVDDKKTWVPLWQQGIKLR